ncbi:hypothetical protein CQW23_28528 [Capsicum baccatum]|uniref:Btz domain-containing protein n=1 Tax=Capsicum baccatum TaxID=33114 RepID=A0A2G2VGS5_CAPBA|nr:hypothetical protein CQW23_28528 [Capsicum baccatum]
MKRREASDYEDESEEEKCESTEKPSRSIDESDYESEGQGAPAVYEEEEYDEEYVEAEEEEELYGEVGAVVEEVVEQGNEEEKKETEPCAVPKTGAFYMHDDRFGDNDRRTSGGRYRGHGRMRGVDSGASQGSRLKAYINGNDQTKDNSQNIQNNPSKAISGRGPRRGKCKLRQVDSVQPSLLGGSTASAQSTALILKDSNDSFGINKLNIDVSIPAVAGKPSSSLQLPPGTASSIKSTNSQTLRGQGRGFNASLDRNYQSPVPNNQVNSVSLPTQLYLAQRYSVQSQGQPFLQVTGQQLVQQPGTGSQVSSPHKTAQAMNTCDPGELEFSSECNKLTSSLVAKGKGSLQGPGRGYGAHIAGASGDMGSGHS